MKFARRLDLVPPYLFHHGGNQVSPVCPLLTRRGRR